MGFENCTAETICRNFLINGAKIQIQDNHVMVQLKKKTHLPILMNVSWMQKTTNIAWHGVNIGYNSWATT